jgi:hypothetical protein
MRGTRWAGVVVVVLALVALLAAGCGKKSTTTPVKKNTTPSTTPQNQVIPKDQQVIYDFYNDINTRHFQNAYNLTSNDFRSQYSSFTAFEDSYGDYVKSVKVVSLTRLEGFSTNQRVEYQAVYDATYIKPFPAAGGVLPPINVVVPDSVNENHWLLDKVATGP